MSAVQLDTVLDRPLPQSPDAERAVLGSILINNNAFYRVIGLVDTEDFFRDAHRSIFATMRGLAEQSREIDLLTLKEELAKRSQLEQVGGSAYISSLSDGIPDVANVERYARIVKAIEEARLQRLEQTAEEGPHAMVRLLARVLGVGIGTADMLVHEVLSRNLRDRRAVACAPGSA